MPSVTVLYFTTLREQKRRESEVVEVPSGTTLAELYASLFPPGPHGAVPVAYARNAERVDARTLVEDGDEVAFLPPLGGG